MSEEFTALEVRDILRPVVAAGRVLDLALINAYTVRFGWVNPSGKTRFRGRYRFTFSDVVALAFLFDMTATGLKAENLVRKAKFLQNRRVFAPGLVTAGEIGRVQWRHETGKLAEDLLRRAVRLKEKVAA